MKRGKEKCITDCEIKVFYNIPLMIIWNRKTTIMFAINLCSDYLLMTKENCFKLFFIEESI